MKYGLILIFRKNGSHIWIQRMPKHIIQSHFSENMRIFDHIEQFQDFKSLARY